MAVGIWRFRAVVKVRNEARHNTETPGWREPPWGADGPQPGAAWTRQRQALLGWAGANTTDCAQRLTRTPVVTAPAVTTHTNGCWACGLLLRLAEQQATRAGQVGARHNGGLVNPKGARPAAAAVAAQTSFSVVTAATLPNSPLC